MAPDPPLALIQIISDNLTLHYAINTDTFSYQKSFDSRDAVIISVDWHSDGWIESPSQLGDVIFDSLGAFNRPTRSNLEGWRSFKRVGQSNAPVETIEDDVTNLRGFRSNRQMSINTDDDSSSAVERSLVRELICIA